MLPCFQKSGSWWQVEYADGKYGYVHGDYMKSISGSFAAQVNTSSGNLNVRQGAGTSYAVQTSLPKGENSSNSLPVWRMVKNFVSRHTHRFRQQPIFKAILWGYHISGCKALRCQL